MQKSALITGITGQDGAYLAQFLLHKGYHVVGAVRRSSFSNLSRLRELGIAQDIQLVDFDLLELSSVFRVIEEVQPDEVYNLAAQSFVGASFERPVYTADCTALGVARLLEAVRTIKPAARFYQASTSEMFGAANETPQSETTRFHPRSPYGVSKLFAHWATVNYRESYGMHASSGILYNHESPLRGEEYVTRKITLSLARIKHRQLEGMELGNWAAVRDWGYAKDYVEGMWSMVQHDVADDYILATGESHSVRDFFALAAEAIGLRVEFEGEGLDEKAVETGTGRAIARVNPDFYRPVETFPLRGDTTKIRNILGWKPKTSFTALVRLMAEADERRVREQRSSS